MVASNPTLPIADYKLLVEAAQADDMMVICEVCGAWLMRDEEAYATCDDFTGCWKAATRNAKFDHLCDLHRAHK